MGATRCSCIFDSHLNRTVEDPTCPATIVHQVHVEVERDAVG